MPILIQNQHGEYTEINTLKFSGGERHVQLEANTELNSDAINLKAFLRNSDDVMDLLMIVNALTHRYAEDTKINIEMPYLPYARQDRVCAEGQAFSLEVFTQLLATQNINELVVWDCHSKVGVELSGARNIEPADIIKHSDELVSLLNDENSVLVCPDKGAVARCTQIKESLGLTGMVRCEKVRDPKTGKIVKTDVLVDDLTGRTAVITDDICDGGFTFIKIAEQLKEKNVEKVVLFVTHGIFSKGLQVFEGLVDHIYTTTSFTHEPNSKLSVINFSHKA